MNEIDETEQHKRKHTIYRLIIIWIVAVLVIGWILMSLPESIKDQGLEFKYVGARVEWSDQYNITITFTNNSSQCNAKVIGIDADGREVEIRKSNICSENITFNIEELLEDKMTIWIEIENIGESIREKQKLVSGE